MKEVNEKPIVCKGGECAEWKIDAFITKTHHDDDMEAFTDARLYSDEQYGYYEREHTICSDTYSSTFRFGKDKVGDVLKYLADYGPYDIEWYLDSLEGCERMVQERYSD